MAIALPAKYSYLNSSSMPLITKEAVKLYGTLEAKGSVDNKVIVNWADEIEDAVNTPYAKWAADWYNDDSIPWCGLFMAVCAVRSNPNKLANRMPPAKYLSALEWQHFGVKADSNDLWIGDIAVKSRQGGGHVTQIVGVSKDGLTLFCLGGNQGDKVGIDPYKKSDFSFFRRIPYNVRPLGATMAILDHNGITNPVTEA